MASVVLVRYGELALKSAPVRREFEQTLRRNILRMFEREGVSCRLRSDRGHLYVETSDGAPSVPLLRRVFGVTSVSRVWPVETDLAKMRGQLVALADPLLSDGTSFAIRARRTGTHPFTSQQLAQQLGGVILDDFAARHLRVDLEAPDVELFVEVRENLTYLSVDRQTGPGGLPLGVAGRLVALVDGTRGAVGAWLMMKRGCRASIVAVGEGIELARGVLSRFDPQLELSEIPGPDSIDTDRELGRLGDERQADAVVLPLSVEEYPAARERWGERVVFSPTVGWLDAEVASRWEGIRELAG